MLIIIVIIIVIIMETETSTTDDDKGRRRHRTTTLSVLHSVARNNNYYFNLVAAGLLDSSLRSAIISSCYELAKKPNKLAASNQLHPATQLNSTRRSGRIPTYLPTYTTSSPALAQKETDSTLIATAFVFANGYQKEVRCCSVCCLS